MAEHHESTHTESKTTGGPTSWGKEIFSSIFGGIGLELGKEALKDVLKAFGQKTGEQIGKDAGGWLSFKLFGIDTEDERRFNVAKEALSPNELTKLNKFLADLTSEQSDYYRLTVMSDKPEEITKILRMHANMSTKDWERECKIMNFNRTAAETSVGKFVNWVRNDFNNAITEAASAIDDDSDRLVEELETLRERRQSWSILNFRFRNS
jgi:hypothetical protein